MKLDCGTIPSAHSCAADARQAAREFHARLGGAADGLVVFFCSSAYDLPALADEINRLFPDVPVVGCTTAGEIGPAGYQDRSLSGVRLPASLCTAVAGRLGPLQSFQTEQGKTFAQGLLKQLEAQAPGAAPEKCFALLLIDGLSVREEPVAHALQMALGQIPLVGGSAGDGLAFSRTWVFHDGAFHADSAVMILAHTDLPFRTFKTQHFTSTDERVVVTDADAAQRIVREIDGLPAAEEYARLTGTAVAELLPARFAASPVVVLIDGTDYVRSIQKVNADGSMTFYCAIDEGMVLRVANSGDLLQNLQDSLQGVRQEIGEPLAVFAFDCILRNLECAQKGLKAQVGDLLRANHAVGFSTYGEQFGGVHVNQTLTGIAIGRGV